MSQQQQPQGKPTSKLVWTVNHEDCLYREAYSPGAADTLAEDKFNRRPKPLDCVVVTWAPGINAHLDSELERCGFKPDRRGMREIVDPTMFAPHTAEAVIKRSKSRKALKQWREIEKRSPVVALIDAALAGKPETTE